MPDPGRISAAIQRLSEIGGDGRAMVSRLAFTEAEREAHALFAEWLRAAGFSARVDAFGNTIGERPGASDGRSSHSGRTWTRSRMAGGLTASSGRRRARSRADDPGERHRHTPPAADRGVRQRGGRPLRRGVPGQQSCHRDDRPARRRPPPRRQRRDPGRGDGEARAGRTANEDARWPDDEVAAYVELHIEQARLLEAQELAIGIVDTVAGNTRLRVVVHGRADHSGGTPMDWRQDALAGAAEMVLEVERIANEPSRRATVATVGRLTSRRTTSPPSPAASISVWTCATWTATASATRSRARGALRADRQPTRPHSGV